MRNNTKFTKIVAWIMIALMIITLIPAVLISMWG